jgi:hypothetical protein
MEEKLKEKKMGEELEKLGESIEMEVQTRIKEQQLLQKQRETEELKIDKNLSAYLRKEKSRIKDAIKKVKKKVRETQKALETNLNEIKKEELEYKESILHEIKTVGDNFMKEIKKKEAMKEMISKRERECQDLNHAIDKQLTHNFTANFAKFRTQFDQIKDLLKYNRYICQQPLFYFSFLGLVMRVRSSMNSIFWTMLLKLKMPIELKMIIRY